jgi:methyl-accepting chemotaxis protein
MPGTQAAALAVAMALAAGGCGAGDDETGEFRDGYNAAVERLNDLTSGSQDLATKPGAQISREFGRIADATEQTRARLQELEPPEDAKDEFDRLLAAIERWVKDLRAAADAARRENREGFAEAVERLAESGAEQREAEKALKDAVDG